MRLVPLLIALAACTVPDASEFDGDVIVVAPGLNGEWDDPDAVANYRDITGTIQQAIALANPGDTILVQSGDFHEDVTFVKNDVRIVGAGAGETRIYGTVTVDGAANPTVDTARLSRVSIINPLGNKTEKGLDVKDAQVFLEQSEVLLWEHGVYLQNADDSYVARNVIRNNKYGVWADYADRADYLNNVIRNNDVAGLTNYFGADGSVAFNTLVGNAFGASAVVGFGGALQFGSATETEAVANNVVVSNFFGVNCQGCANDFKSNLVWGNYTNYTNDASPQSDDLAVDPRFVSAGNFDFRLTVGSPAVDAANGTINVTEDFHGEPRPSGLRSDIGADELVQSGFSLLVTEVMANPVVESSGEFAEIYNAGSSAVDLAGLVITDGDEVDTIVPFNAGTTVLAAGAYAVVVDRDYNGVYSIPAGVTVVTTNDTEVGNGLTSTDRITLLEDDGTTTIATSNFALGTPPDGLSLEMVVLAQGDVAGNWRGSVCSPPESAGEPACFPPAGDPADLVITEVLTNAADEATGEFIELWNKGANEIDAAGLVIGDGTGTDKLVGFANTGTLVQPGEHAVIIDSGYAFEYALPNDIAVLTTEDGSALGSGGLANTAEAVTLYKADGTTVISSFGTTFAATDAGNAVSWQRNSYAATDVTGSWVRGNVGCTTGMSPGRLNPAAGGLCTTLIVTEVMANPENEGAQEFVEIFNAGTDSVDLTTVQISDGTQTEALVAFMGGPTVLAPGAYAVVVDRDYQNTVYQIYGIPASVVKVTTPDTTIGSNLALTDRVWLNFGGSRLDIYNFPFNPGNGISAEQIDIFASDAPENWTAAPCASGASPGLANCAQGGNTGGSGTSLYELVITEVMANAIDEDKDEFVEIHNFGTTPIDVSLFTLFDGDQLDTLHDFWGGTDTIVQPGDYAVILDNEYDIVADPYGLAAEPTLLTTSDTTMASGLSTADSVYFLEPDGITLIDSFTHPSNPGNGVSVEKADRLGGDIASNWRASSCANETAGAQNCP